MRMVSGVLVPALVVPVFVLMYASMVRADLVFDIGPAVSNGGTISWSGGSDPLVGSGIDVTQISYDGEPALPVAYGLLSFQTGSSAGGWAFGPGGAIGVTGEVPGDQTAETLLSGSFLSAQVIPINGTSFQVVIGGITNTNSPNLTGYFDIPSGEYTGALTCILSGPAVEGQSFEYEAVQGGEIADSPVPLPGAVWPLAPGLAGLFGIKRRVGFVAGRISQG